jgi:hypothetical protein
MTVAAGVEAAVSHNVGTANEDTRAAFTPEQQEVTMGGVPGTVVRVGLLPEAWIRAQDPDEIGRGLHHRFAQSYHDGLLMTPEQSAKELLWGLSPRLGPVGYDSDSPGYLGDSPVTSRPYAEPTQLVVDEEVSRLVRDAEHRATELLTSHQWELNKIVQLLLEKETIDAANQPEITIGHPGQFLQEDKGEEPAEVVVDFVARTTRP